MSELQSILRRVHCDGCKDDAKHHDGADVHEKQLDAIQAEIEVMDWVNRVIGSPSKASEQQPCFKAQTDLIHIQRVRAGL